MSTGSVWAIPGLDPTGTPVPGYVVKADADGNPIWSTVPPATPYTSTVDPTVNDDSADGFSAGSSWFNSSTQTFWQCASAAVGAALWIALGASAAIFTGGVLEFYGGTLVFTDVQSSGGTVS